ncbi:hypothetical protein Vadar_019810 [Vaccinium darrowii]|uniref:Uncharacterized protein n=1 Tax=Vaccinium darrowii TaxID=229202 RepID=A0ACB7XIV9_9ERIC|nr:hypothetical protein Vadar_019810 [Vaccinium darrowii]
MVFFVAKLFEAVWYLIDSCWSRLLRFSSFDCCRQSLGLPLEEPGRFVDASYFGSSVKDEYDPSNPVYRYDYWGEPKNTEKSRQQQMADAHT